MFRPRAAILVVIAFAAFAGCAIPGGSFRPDALPPREEGLSFLGAGRERIDRRHFEPVIFQNRSWRLAEAEQEKITRIAAGLGGDRRALLAGVGDEGWPDDYNRVLGEARAQTVRQSLIAAGVAPKRLQTVSYGGEWPEGSDIQGLSRVVVGLVK